MSLHKFSHISILRSMLLVLFAVSTLLLGGARAEAASSAWTYELTYPICPPASTFLFLTASYSYDSYDNPTFLGWFDSNNTQYFGTVVTNPGYIGEPLSPVGCLPAWSYGSQTVAWFNASSNKDVYNPGETVSVSLSAYNGSSGDTSGILNWTFGGTGTVNVGINAVFNGSMFAACSGGGGTTGCSGSFTAPTAPGTYTIALTGCQNSAYCNGSSISFTIAAAACALPWGGTLASGSSVTAYQSPSVTSPATCSSIAQTRTCTNGTLSGSYTNQSCTVTPPPAPSASISASPTTVAFGSGTGLSWSSSNTQYCERSGVGSNGAYTSGQIGTSGSANTSPLIYNPTTFALRCLGFDGTYAYSSATVYISCAAGTSWNGSSCVANACTNGANNPTACNTCTSPQVWNGSSCVAPASGTISASPNPCTVASGASACTSNISWSTTNTPSATVTIGASTFASGTSGTQAAPWISPSGPGVFILKDSNGNQLATVSVNAVCTSGTSWVGGVCAPGTTPSGNISPNSCTISAGASSCAMNVAWNSANTTGTVTVQRGYSPFGTIASGTSGNQSFTFAPPGTFILNLLDGATQLGSANFTASCVSGSTWNGSSCVANACSNGANNPTACNTCTSPQVWNGSSCVAPASCSATTIGGCDLSGTASGGTSGSCSSGYSGSCSYSCNSGTWSANSNSCAVVQSCTTSACTSAANFCGQTNQGTVSSCGGGCNAATPSDSLCPPPTVSITASPNRVRSGNTSIISWSSSYAQSCSITKNGTAWRTGLSSAGTSDTITTQSVYQISCTGPGGTASASVPATVNVVPAFQEF